jgi:hypothetical protein
MTLLMNFSLSKMSPPNEGEVNDNWEDDELDIDRWENDGGMNAGSV